MKRQPYLYEKLDGFRSKAIMFWKDQSGASAIEYGLLAALIGVALIIGARATGHSLQDIFEKVYFVFQTPAVEPPPSHPPPLPPG